MKLQLRLIGAATIVALLSVTTVAGQDAAAEEQQNDDTQMQPVSEEPVKRVHKLNPGEREYLSPNLIGVQNIAMTFLPLTMNFVNIVDAFREIVNGVRYEIVLNAVNTKDNDADIICRLVILEKPWLRTQWGDKVRELQHTNCTSEEDNLTDPMARSNALNDKYQSNALFNGGSRNELSIDDMAKLESQIMPFSSGNKKRVAPAETASSFTTSTTSTTTTTEAPIEETQTRNIQNEKDEQEEVAATTVAPADDDETSTPQPAPLSDDEMKWLDDFLSVGAVNFENSQQINNENQNEAAPQNENADGDSNYLQQQQSAELQSSPQASSEEQEQRFNDNQQPQGEGHAEQQFEEAHTRSKRGSNTLVGGVSKLEAKEAETELQSSLDKLASGEGPTYKVSKVHSASRQMVSGTLTKIDADLINDQGDVDRCDIEIWSRIWLANGNEVTIDCPNKETVKRRHSRSVEYAEKKTHKKHNHHNLEKTEHLFNKFQVKFSRRYANTMERQMRLRIFKQNLRIIEQLNANEMGSAKYGLTEFADMTSTEYKERTGLWQRETGKPSVNAPAVIPDVELPKEFDWRTKNVITKVKNQQSCGSCWAFSVTGNIEGLHAVKTGVLEEYSEQELLDCDTVDSACNGGLPDNAYEAIQKIGGLELESEYPYHARKEQCHFNKTMAHVKVTGAVDLPKNETAMAQWLLANGPISIGINANAMQFYRGGVSHPWKMLCAHSNLDHGVLIVGYGVSDYPMFKKTLPYWIVKNSWGEKWGEQGYYRVYRGDNTCGVSEMASSAVLADN